ncbi:4Fe-4S dicluster domain-containing protein [Brachybacterium timonense]|uniref:4Fe-4S dicluster domain-containing protein n=1 Tax=Brachybacterium timonense TaxID=2050896 RepID=UPI000D0B1011|nr:4Fe-4S dicluster domain-containing protein [Brachybacterium timonense]
MTLLSGPEGPIVDTGWGHDHSRKGFFTDTSICIGCKACEVACKEWNQNPADGERKILGSSYDNTGALGANTWRHVAFVEQGRERIEEARESGRRLVSLGMPTIGKKPDSARGALPEGDLSDVDRTPPDTPEFRWLMSSDVCKHCTNAGCLDVCPTGALFRSEHGSVVVQQDICNGCGTCVGACPFGVIERRDDGTISPKESRDPRVDTEAKEMGTAHKCTLCYDRLVDGEQPACAKTCPTTSIKFGTREDMVASAQERVRELHERGMTEARLYGANSKDGVGGTGSVFLLLDEPEVYGLPPDPQVPTKDLPSMYARVGIAAVGMAAAALLAFAGGRR